MPKKKPSGAQPKRWSDTVEVHKASLEALMDGFETLLSGQAPRLDAWLKDYMPEKEFDQHLRSLGEAVGRDFGIL